MALAQSSRSNTTLRVSTRPMVSGAAAAAVASSDHHSDRGSRSNDRSTAFGDLLPNDGRPNHRQPSTKAEEDLIRVDKRESELVASKSLAKLSAKKHWLVDHVCFTTFISTLVFVNAVQMGIEVDYPEEKDLWKQVDHVFGAIFFIEMVLKLVCLRLNYFRDRWNWLDGSLALMGFMDTWFLTIVGGKNLGLQQFSILRILRLLRLVRLARLFRQFSKLVIVMKSIVDAVESTLWVAFCLVICIYVCAIFCVGFIGNAPEGTYPGYSKVTAEIDEQEIMTNFNPYIVFGSMSTAMVSLFNIAIFAEWTEIVRPVLLKQPPLVFFFIAFAIFVCFGVMNVIIGMIVDSVMQNSHTLEMELQASEREDKVRVLETVKEVVFHKDSSGDIKVDMDELARLLLSDDDRIKIIMDKVKLPHGCCPEELLSLLDANGNGTLEHDEFCQTFYRLIFSDNFQQSCMLQMGVNRLHRKSNEQSAELVSISKLLEEQRLAFAELRKDMQTRDSRQAMELAKQSSLLESLCRNNARLEEDGCPASGVPKTTLVQRPVSPGERADLLPQKQDFAACCDTVCQEVTRAVQRMLPELVQNLVSVQNLANVLGSPAQASSIDRFYSGSGQGDGTPHKMEISPLQRHLTSNCKQASPAQEPGMPIYPFNAPEASISPGASSRQYSSIFQELQGLAAQPGDPHSVNRPTRGRNDSEEDEETFIM